MRLAVVGHVEWVDFVLADRLPRAGEILQARDGWEGPAGGGAMAATALRALTGAATFFCAVGDDDRAQRTVEGLRAAGLEVQAGVRAGRAQRRTVTLLTADHERTIVVVGEPLEPHGDDAVDWPSLAGFDGVLLFAGDAAAARAARRAAVVVSTGRARAGLLDAGVAVDALVGSAHDPLEVVDDALLAATRPRWVVETDGARGGSWRAVGDEAAAPRAGRWDAVPAAGPPVDAFGCGDAFAAALMAALAARRSIADACALGARVGAAVLCERAPAVGDLSPLWRDAS